MNAAQRQAVLDRARQGDAQALGDLLESYRPYVRVLARARCDGRLRVRIDESDLIQDALLEAHRCFAAFTGHDIAELAAWLRLITIRSTGHTVRRHLGADKRNLAHEAAAEDMDLLAASDSTPSAQAMKHEQAARIAEALGRLPEDMQQVVLARLMDGREHGQIAQEMGRSEAAIRVLYCRAVRRLREECR